MKKLLKYLAVAVMIIAPTIFSGCKEDEDGSLEELTLRGQSKIFVDIDRTATVLVRTGNGGYKVSIDNAAVASATVDENQITILGISKGSATMTVTDMKNQTVTAQVNVRKAIEDMTLETTEATVVNGSTGVIKILTGNEDYTVTSENSAIAQASVADNAITVEGKSNGTTILTVTDGIGKTVKVNVIVGSSFDVKLSKSKAVLLLGGSMRIAIVSGNGGYTVATDKPAVADVTMGSSGILIAAKAEGVANLTVKDKQNKTASIVVTVVKPLKAAKLTADNYIRVPFVEEYAVQDPALRNMSAITFETLFKFDVLAATLGLNTVMGLESNFQIRNHPNGGGTINLNALNMDLFSTTVIQLNKWYHVAATFDGAKKELKLYINGVLEAEGTTAATFLDMGVSGGGAAPEYRDFFIGASSDNGRGLCGAASETRIWSKALTQQEIADNMATVAPNTAGLLAYWKLNNGGTVSAFTDLTNNGYNATTKLPVTVWETVELP